MNKELRISYASLLSLNNKLSNSLNYILSIHTWFRHFINMATLLQTYLPLITQLNKNLL